MPATAWHLMSDRSVRPLLPVYFPEVRPPLFWPGSIEHLPPALGGPALKHRMESDSNFSLALLFSHVNGF